VHGKKKNKLVVGILLGLNLLQHSLTLLKQDKSFLVALLRNKVDRTLIQLVDDNWNLV
jgi:hypothetical protein